MESDGLNDGLKSLLSPILSLTCLTTLQILREMTVTRSLPKFLSSSTFFEMMYCSLLDASLSCDNGVMSFVV